MATVMCLTGYLLLFLVTATIPSSDPDVVFGVKGGCAKLHLHSFPVDYAVLYRVSADGGLIQLNCSQAEWPQLQYGIFRDTQSECHMRCDTQSNWYRSGRCLFVIQRLTLSHSGDYMAEGWKGGNLTRQQSFRLIVCAEGSGLSSEQEVVFDDSAVICRLDAGLEPGSSLQLYQSTVPQLSRIQSTEDLGSNMISKTLVLNTNLSLEPLVEELKGRLQVDLKNSQVTLSGNMGADSGDWYCTIWRGAQCQTYRHSIINRKQKNVFAYEQENLTLHCISKRKSPKEAYWRTPKGDVRVRDNQTQQQEVKMYMPNSSQTGNYSLIIPSVSLQHSGSYDCANDYIIKIVTLYVCAKPSPLNVRFSQGGNVLLDVSELINASWFVEGVQWYRQKVLEPKVLILDTENKSVLFPEDLRERVTVIKLPPYYSLLISNLTPEDSGMYTSRVIGKERREWSSYERCTEGTIHLLYRDPFGVDSPFYRAYASFVGCVLLGMVATVIWFNLKNRVGELNSGGQNGDEDIYDYVDLAEDKV